MIKEILIANQITNFTESEILNGYSENNIPVDLIPNIAPTLRLLQLIRTDIGKPIIIHSAYRNKAHNDSVKGKSNSLHLVFNAIDFAPTNTTVEELEDIHIRFLQMKYVFNFTFLGTNFRISPRLCGIGLYQTFIHIDTRGLLGRLSPAIWRI